MSRTRPMTAARTIVAIGAAGLLLTGCGSATPGLAAQVGDQEISTSRVDEAAANFCTALGDQLETAVPMSFVRKFAVERLALRAQAEQIAEEYDVEPGSTYGDDVAQRERTAATMPEEVRADFVDLNTAGTLAQDVLEQVGRIELEERGVAEPTPEQVTQAGIDVFNVWPDANGIEVNPRYGLENVDGVLTPVDTNVSVAVSDVAQSGLGAEPDVAYTNTLPRAQRCG